jgi:hypothetical protein
LSLEIIHGELIQNMLFFAHSNQFPTEIVKNLGKFLRKMNNFECSSEELIVTPPSSSEELIVTPPSSSEELIVPLSSSEELILTPPSNTQKSFSLVLEVARSFIKDFSGLLGGVTSNSSEKIRGVNNNSPEHIREVNSNFSNMLQRVTNKQFSWDKRET